MRDVSVPRRCLQLSDLSWSSLWVYATYEVSGSLELFWMALCLRTAAKSSTAKSAVRYIMGKTGDKDSARLQVAVAKWKAFLVTHSPSKCCWPSS